MFSYALPILNIEMPHFEDSPGGLPADGEGLWENIVKGLPSFQPLPELWSHPGQLLIAHSLIGRLYLIYLVHEGLERFEHTLIVRSEYLRQNFHDYAHGYLFATVATRPAGFSRGL